MVQLGAYIGSRIGQRFSLGRVNRTTICSKPARRQAWPPPFRSPAGGVLLTLEVFGARFNQRPGRHRNRGSRRVSHAHRPPAGDAYPFRPQVPIDALLLPTLLFVVPIMGLVAAPTGHLFICMFERFKTVFPRIGRSRRASRSVAFWSAASASGFHRCSPPAIRFIHLDYLCDGMTMVVVCDSARVDENVLECP